MKNKIVVNLFTVLNIINSFFKTISRRFVTLSLQAIQSLKYMLWFQTVPKRVLIWNKNNYNSVLFNHVLLRRSDEGAVTRKMLLKLENVKLNISMRWWIRCIK